MIEPGVQVQLVGIITQKFSVIGNRAGLVDVDYAVVSVQISLSKYRASSIISVRLAWRRVSDADVLLLFEQVCGERVPQAVQRDTLVDPGGPGCFVDASVQLPARQGVEAVYARKQPPSVHDHVLGAWVPPSSAQPLQHQGGEDGVAIFTPLGLLDAQHHALAVHVRGLQCQHFAGTEPRPIS